MQAMQQSLTAPSNGSEGDMDEVARIAKIVMQVLSKLESGTKPARQVLVIHDESAPLDASIMAIPPACPAGIRFDVVAVPAAGGTHLREDDLEIYSAVIVYPCTPSIIAEAALGLTLTPMGEALVSILWGSVPVICICSKQFAQVLAGEDSIGAFQKMYRSYGNRLKEFGVRFTTAGEVHQELQHICGPGQVESEQNSLSKRTLVSWITVADIKSRAILPGATFRLPVGARLTPMAADWLREKRVNVLLITGKEKGQ